ncbi:hypothetical protein HDU85_003790 [Gaertneriomyces sp. JEL0708]|nr:hypothetical protein HDU85_003790 [Gaertneriomyces sp. JEL0708]
MSRPVVFENVAYFKEKSLDFVKNGNVRIEKGRIASLGEALATEDRSMADQDTLVIDCSGYLLLPGFVNAAVAFTKSDIPEDVLAALDLSARVQAEDVVAILSDAVDNAVATGTTTLALLGDGPDLKPLQSYQKQVPGASQCVIPFIAEHDKDSTYVPLDSRPELTEIVRDSSHTFSAKMVNPYASDAKEERNLATTHYSIYCPSSGLGAKQATGGHAKRVTATGNVLLNSTNLWRELEIEARLLVSGGADEQTLKSLLQSVTTNPAELLGLFDAGVIREGAWADLMLVKIKPQWQCTPKGILMSLFLHGSDPSFVHAVFKEGALHHSAGPMTNTLQALSLEKYYASANTPDMPTLRNGAEEAEFDTIEDAIESFRKGEFLIVVDNEDRENEGDLIIAGEDLTPEKAAFMIRYTSGMICVTVDPARLDELQLPQMVQNNTESLRTAYTVSTDYKHGSTTGISAADRSRTIRALADPTAKADDFVRPGHVFPLRPVLGGTLRRVGHTEAGLDFAKLAGKRPVTAICEIVLDHGPMARRDDLKLLAKRWGVRLVTISDLVKYRVKHGLGLDW